MLNDNAPAISMISLDNLKPNPFQYRKTFVQIDELAKDIESRGIIEPLLVSSTGNGNYKIIAGERRWRAAKQAGIKKVPCIVKSADPAALNEIGLVDNVQRESLSRLELLFAIHDLLSRGKKASEVAVMIGKKDESYISMAKKTAEFFMAVINGGFMTYEEVDSLSRSRDVHMRVFYEAAKFAEEVDDLSAAVHALKEAVNRNLNRDAAIDVIRAMRNRKEEGEEDGGSTETTEPELPPPPPRQETPPVIRRKEEKEKENDRSKGEGELWTEDTLIREIIKPIEKALLGIQRFSAAEEFLISDNKKASAIIARLAKIKGELSPDLLGLVEKKLQ